MNQQNLFWADAPKVSRPPAAIETNCIPPERTWERPGYLPGLDEALAFDGPFFTNDELRAAAMANEPLVFDVEIFPNYLLIAFMSVVSGKLVLFESTLPLAYVYQPSKLEWIFENFLTVGFNSNSFDIPMAALAIAGCNVQTIKEAADAIIQREEKPWKILRAHKLKTPEWDSIDLIEVCPLDGSLKAYGGRLHAERLQDLPFKPDTELSPEQIAIVRHYCVNDLKTTALIFRELEDQLSLRVEMSRNFGTDLRSKSDAQIAEAVINRELHRLNGFHPERPEIEPGTSYRYKVPGYLRFSSPMMREALEIVANADFVLGENGQLGLPASVASLRLRIGSTEFQMGLGGLHSCEKRATFKADTEHVLIDRDVASYYPAIILNQGLFPKHLGPNFLQVYRQIVERRLKAKREKNKVEADSLKITINGSFGKFGSPWSTLYSPDLMLQVTISGQLSLLMLIERLELAGVECCSANTDGILLRCRRDRLDRCREIIGQWEKETGFETEEGLFKSVHAKDVNNYIGVKENGKVKLKGEYSDPWSDKDAAIFRFHKNPVATVCIHAAIEFLKTGRDPMATIKECRDVRQFVVVRTVKGGAVKDWQYLGRLVRWYYARGEAGDMVYAASGKKVPLSNGAKPLMTLPAELPKDLNFNWYERRTMGILWDIGAIDDLPEEVSMSEWFLESTS